MSTPSSKFVFFQPIWKTRWPPLTLIGWDIFDFFSETAEQNSTKLVRKQDLNVLYQVCVFGPIWKTRWPSWSLIGWDNFDFSSLTAERNSTKLDRKQDFNVLYQFCFSCRSEKQDGRPDSDWLRHFRHLLKLLNRIEQNLSGSKISTSSTKFVFWGGWEKQDGRPGLLLAETFSTSPLKPLNRFLTTWQEARSQCPVPSLCFSGRSEKQDVRWDEVLLFLVPFQNFSRVLCTQVSDSGPLGLLFLFA